VGGILMTEMLVSVFGGKSTMANATRGAGIGAMDALSAIKKALVLLMLFGA
jgi:hypothetical protein